MASPVLTLTAVRVWPNVRATVPPASPRVSVTAASRSVCAVTVDLAVNFISGIPSVPAVGSDTPADAAELCGA